MHLVTYPSHRLLRELSTTTSSSCFSVEQQPKPALIHSSSSCPRQSHAGRNRVVRFSECENEVYFDPEDLTKEEIAAGWYSKEELEHFRIETAQLASQLLLAPDSRRKAIQRSYHSFCCSSFMGNATRIDATVDFLVTETTRGMEKYMLLPRERELRMMRLRQQVQYWSTTIDCREDDRCAMTRKASERESLPCRLFAYYIATVAMETNFN